MSLHLTVFERSMVFERRIHAVEEARDDLVTPSHWLQSGQMFALGP